MVRKVLAFLSIAFTLAVSPGVLSAHGGAMAAAVSSSGKEVVVRLLDVYGAPIEGARVNVAFGLPDRKPGKLIGLPEKEKGVFRGPVMQPPADIYEITVEATFVGELFRSSLRVKQGEPMAEVLLPLAEILPDGGVDWTTYLYIGAIIGLVTATAVALLRRRPPANSEETES